ncbi:GntR family transcriptional regulator [Compostimonas suwonensis]|uniref:DNA-binding GntR family transcriptional regulator n=1 Tax=Compostimonas suwonensis TaxID=1048394 RepID=A0A2M9BYR5_9MICO|nr:GntR family transcriptional regulator [Compostimonas suwonensis]PJJ63222.1 DNA-binding GntR family transcriptional regulator [Compostimonas suwonensis]
MAQISQTVLIYDRLRAEILDLDRTPGARLTERGLETEFSASRTPVRAALVRLQAEGLVQRDGRAWQVSPIDLGEIAALSEFREAVETEAVRLACERASDSEIAALDELLDEFRPGETSDEGVRMGTSFHVELARLSQNRFLVEGLEQAMTRLARTRWLEVRTAQARQAAWQEHRDIVATVAARQTDAAVALVRAHIVTTHERLTASLNAEQRMLRARGLSIVGA